MHLIPMFIFKKFWSFENNEIRQFFAGFHSCLIPTFQSFTLNHDVECGAGERAGDGASGARGDCSPVSTSPRNNTRPPAHPTPPTPQSEGFRISLKTNAKTVMS